LKSIVIEDSIILGKQLYPIGSVDISELEDYGSSDRAVLMVADDGVIYSSLSYVIRQEGCDINDFINRVIDTQFLWKDNEAMVINYSQNDPRLKEFRKKELLEKKRR
jgi:alkyl hydroperoxide reductase subunit AhpC